MACALWKSPSQLLILCCWQTDLPIDQTKMIRHIVTVMAGPDSGTVFTILPGSQYKLGRDLACAARLADPLVSREHGILFQSPSGQLIFRDTSRNGTYYVSPGKATVTVKQTDVVLNVGDMLLLGETALRSDGVAGAEPLPAPLSSVAATAVAGRGSAATPPGSTFAAKPALDITGISELDLRASTGLPSSPTAAPTHGRAHIMPCATSSAREILEHPFTRLAIERGRQRRSEEAAAAPAAVATSTAGGAGGVAVGGSSGRI